MSQLSDALHAAEAAQQARYSGRPDVTDFAPSSDTEVLEGHAHEIIPGLFLGSNLAVGSVAMAPALQELGVTAILNCTTDSEVPCVFEQPPGSTTTTTITSPTSSTSFSCSYARIAVHDNDLENIAPYLSGGADFIARHLKGGGKVAVHCMRGVSRSATLVLAFLIKHRGMSRDEAYVVAKRQRPLINPNPGFWRQLGDFEEECRPRSVQGAGDGSRGATASAAIVFDEAWCRQSLATFSMFGEAAFPPSEEPSWDRRAALAAGLDFILSRAIAPSDVLWLKALCAACDRPGMATTTTTTSSSSSSSSSSASDDNNKRCRVSSRDDDDDDDSAVASSTGTQILHGVIFDDPEFLENWESDFRRATFVKLLRDVGWDEKEGDRGSTAAAAAAASN